MSTTCWMFNETLDFSMLSTSISAYPAFTCPNHSSSINYVFMFVVTAGRLEYEGVNGSNWVTAYLNGAWADDSYRYIEIAGDSGPSYPKTVFMNWLKANAVRIGPAPLVKVGGAWKEAAPLVKISGSWKEVSNAYVKVGDTWKEI